MVAIALVGADGAGKTTVGRSLERAGDPPVKYLYMGVNAGASNVLLPTTRLARALRRRLGGGDDPAGGPPDPEARARREAAAAGGWLRPVRSLKRGLSLGNRLAEEWYRQLVSWWYQRRGYVVLYDRHFRADYHAHDVRGESADLSRRIHGSLLRRFYPRPDLLIVLDAPAEVLFARKPEGTPDLLERRRQEYLELAGRPGECATRCAIVDASRPAEEVLSEVTRLVRDSALGNRNGGSR